MTSKRNIILLACIFLLITCAPHYSVVEPTRRDMGGLYSVEPQISWNRSSQKQIEIWTVDGPLLAAVQFFNGIDHEKYLFQYIGRAPQSAKLPRFNKNMTASEVLEFVVDSIMAPYPASPIGPNMIGINAEATQLRPFKFGSLPGFRFELAFLSKAGLEYQGFVVGTIKDDRLYLICYSGARQYYYPKYKDTAERIVASIQVPNGD